MLSRTPLLKRFAGDRSGLAAIEFALVAPMMAAALVLTLDVSLYVVNRTRMHSGIRAGIQYLIDNGRDLDQLETIVAQAWTEKPANAVIESERYCLCSDVVHACNVLCADSSAPESYFSISATGTLEGLMSDRELAATEELRVR
jgi:Flp pilus assembly protein TadG